MTNTIKFNFHDELLELQARVYLETKVKLTKKDLLGIVFTVGLRNYQEILEAVIATLPKQKRMSIKEILDLTVDLGEGSEELSEQIDNIVYKE